MRLSNYCFPYCHVLRFLISVIIIIFLFLLNLLISQFWSRLHFFDQMMLFFISFIDITVHPYFIMTVDDIASSCSFVKTFHFPILFMATCLSFFLPLKLSSIHSSFFLLLVLLTFPFFLPFVDVFMSSSYIASSILSSLPNFLLGRNFFSLHSFHYLHNLAS